MTFCGGGGEKHIAALPVPSEIVLQTPETTERSIFVGIDIGYKTHVVCACPATLFNAKRYPDGWKRAKTVHFSSDAKGFKHLQRYLDTFSSSPKSFLILVEPTGGYYGLALQMYLVQKGYDLVQVENKAVKKYREDIFGSETKTDDTDSRLMARMGFLHEWVGEEFSIQPVHIATPDEAVIRLMSRDLLKLGKEIGRRKNQLHQVLAFTFPELKTFFKDDVTGIAARKLIKQFPTPQELSKASVEEIAKVLHTSRAYQHAKRAHELQELAQHSVGLKLVSHHVWRQAWMLEQIEVLETARSDLLVQLTNLLETHSYTPIIHSLPVKSPTWTALLISMIGNIERFHNYGEFRAYAGWYPKVSQSGTSMNSSRLAEGGNRQLRLVFGQMAQVLIAPSMAETPFRLYFQRLTDRGMKPSVAVGHLAGKLATVLYQCLKTMTPYDLSQHRQHLGLPPGEVRNTSVTVSSEVIEETETSEIPVSS